MLIWTFEWTALSLNDVKHYLKVVEIVYGEKMMVACLLDLLRTGWKGPHWKSWETVWCCFQWSFVDNVRNLPMLSLPLPSSKSFNDVSFAWPVTWIIDCLSTFAALSFFTTVFLSLWLRSPLLDVSKGVFLMIFFIICLIMLLTPSRCFLYQTWDCRSREGKTSAYVLLEKLNWTSWTTSGDHSGKNCEIVLSPPSLDVL